MPANETSFQYPQNEADELKPMATAYLQCKSEAERLKIRDEIAAYLLNNPIAQTMIRSMLISRGKGQDRFEDAQQEAVSLFVMSVLPNLRNPLAIWGAFKGAIKVTGQRLSVDFFDHERISSISLDDMRDQFDTEHSYAENLLVRDEQSIQEEQSLIEQMAMKRAKEAIYENLLASKMNGKNPLSWLTRLNEPYREIDEKEKERLERVHDSGIQSDDLNTAALPSALPVVRLLAKDSAPRVPLDSLEAVGPAKWAASRINAKIEPTESYHRLIQIRDDTGLTNESLARALNIGIARLRSYVNLKYPVHSEVLARAEQWYRGEGKRRKELLEELHQKSLHEWIETWKIQTRANSYAALAEIIGISVPTMTRWRKPDTKAMHNEHLINAALRVKKYIQLSKRQQNN